MLYQNILFFMSYIVMESLMKKTIEHYAQELTGFQTGRASPWLVSHIKVEVYGDRQPISNLGNVWLMDAQTLKIEPRDKSTISKIEKAIFESDAKLTPQNMWDYIMIKIPPLTTDRRKELSKMVSKLWEDNKVAIRNIRQDNIKTIKKEFDEKLLGEDDKNRAEQEVEKMTKEYITIIETMTDSKIDEITNG